MIKIEIPDNKVPKGARMPWSFFLLWITPEVGGKFIAKFISDNSVPNFSSKFVVLKNPNIAAQWNHLFMAFPHLLLNKGTDLAKGLI